MRALSIALVCGFVSMMGATAYAQEPAPTPPAAQQPPDVVLLNNGGMFRGTISERVPNDYVLLITATGEQRRFSMAEVKYAGPASEMPTSAPAPATPAPPPPPASAPSGTDKVKPFATIHGQEARLKLQAGPGITFHRRSGSAAAGNIVAVGYDVLCTAPCDVSVPAGSHVFALSKGTETPVEAKDPVQLPPGNSTVRGEIVDRSGIRTAGWLVLAASLAGGGYLMITANEDVEKCDSSGCDTQPELNTTKLIVGTVVLAGGMTAGLLMSMTRDGSSFTVTPGSPAALQRSPRLDARSFVDLGGLIATAHF